MDALHSDLKRVSGEFEETKGGEPKQSDPLMQQAMRHIATAVLKPCIFANYPDGAPTGALYVEPGGRLGHAPRLDPTRPRFWRRPIG